MTSSVCLAKCRTFSPPTVSFWQIPTIHHILGVYLVNNYLSQLNMCLYSWVSWEELDSSQWTKKLSAQQQSWLSWVEKLFTTLPIKRFDHSQKPLNCSPPPIESELLLSFGALASSLSLKAESQRWELARMVIIMTS